MKDKIFQLLKQAYKSLGLGDDVLQAHADMLAGTGIVTEDNVQTIVESQKSFLESLQKENDRRVTEARAKLQAEQKAKEDAAKKLAEEEALKKAEEDKKKAEEEAEAKRLEEFQKKNEVPEYLKKYFEEQAAKEKQAKEDAAKEREEYKRLVESITKSNNEQKDAYTKQLEEQNVTIKSLQETIQKQQEEAKAKEEAAAKAKAKAEHDAKILSKAKELGIPQSRIEEGFVIAEDADDDTIGNYLTKVANNYKAQQQPVLGAFPLQRAGEPTKEDVDNVAENLVKNL